MMSRALTKKLLLLSLVLSSIICFSRFGWGDTQQIIDQINNLPDGERQRTLVEETKKQGVVYWYADMQPQNADAVVKLLAERFPFLKVEIVRLGRDRLINRLMTEYRAGKFIPDVISASSAFVDELRNAGIITRNAAPFRKFLRPGLTDEDGWVNSVSTAFYTMFYNTKLVKKDDLPKRYEDLLQSRWNGMISLDQEDVEWLAALVETMGRNNAIAFAKKLAANRLNVRRGHTLLGQLVVGGESALFPDQYLHSAINLKNSGAPVDVHFIEPVLTQTSDAVWVARNAPRIHASLFFNDFLFSREVQTMLAGFGRLASRRDVSLSYGLDAKKTHYLSRQWVGENYQELTNLFRGIFTP